MHRSARSGSLNSFRIAAIKKSEPVTLFKGLILSVILGCFWETVAAKPVAAKPACNCLNKHLRVVLPEKPLLLKGMFWKCELSLDGTKIDGTTGNLVGGSQGSSMSCNVWDNLT